MVDDFVLRRSDGVPAYNLAVVVDDAEQGVGEVVRGADLLDSTPRQLLLARLLGLPDPAYAHVPLVLGPDGARLAKRHGAVTLADRLALGETIPRIVGWMARAPAWASRARSSRRSSWSPVRPGFHPARADDFLQYLVTTASKSAMGGAPRGRHTEPAVVTRQRPPARRPQAAPRPARALSTALTCSPSR